MQSNHQVVESANTLLALAHQGMHAAYHTMGPILLGEPLHHESFLRLEREAIKMSLLTRAVMVAQSISRSSTSVPTAIEEIRAVWAELQKWPGISPELSDAFEAFREPSAVRPLRRRFGVAKTVI